MSVEGLACFMLLHVALALEVTPRGDPRSIRTTEPGTLAARFAPSRSLLHSWKVPPAGNMLLSAPPVSRWCRLLPLPILGCRATHLRVRRLGIVYSPI